MLHHPQELQANALPSIQTHRKIQTLFQRFCPLTFPFMPISSSHACLLPQIALPSIYFTKLIILGLSKKSFAAIYRTLLCSKASTEQDPCLFSEAVLHSINSVRPVTISFDFLLLFISQKRRRRS